MYFDQFILDEDGTILGVANVKADIQGENMLTKDKAEAARAAYGDEWTTLCKVIDGEIVLDIDARKAQIVTGIKAFCQADIYAAYPVEKQLTIGHLRNGTKEQQAAFDQMCTYITNAVDASHVAEAMVEAANSIEELDAIEAKLKEQYGV